LSQLTKPANEVRVAFIITAVYGTDEDPWWMRQNREQLVNCGIKNIENLDFREKSKQELDKALADKDIIYVNGGNTFFLLHWVRKSGFDKLLQKLLDDGKLYVGQSAGSYVVCPTIEVAEWKGGNKNTVGLKDLTALNLIPFLIKAHFEENYRAIIENAEKNTSYPIVALYDGQAVLVEDDRYKVIGRGRKEFFNGFTENFSKNQG